MKPALLWGIVLVPALFLEKTIYAQADLARDREVTALARLFPLYAPIPAQDLASRVLGASADASLKVELGSYDDLDYPLARPAIDPRGPRPNVLVLVVDCLRQDMLAPETMPRVSIWASHDVRRFDDHASGGNSTRYALFSLLYGLHGSYWFPFLKERRSPVLVDELIAEDYDFGVFSAASQDFPELRDTAWVRIPESVHDEFGTGPAWQRDELAAAGLIDWIEDRGPREPPFFGFLLLDSPHQTYSHPPQAAPFQPSAPDLDYMAMTQNAGPAAEELERVKNRYKNAVHHADAVLGGVLEALDRSPLSEETLVFVTGDHGEEFRECGFFGHTSAYTKEQVRVPLLVRGPGIPPGVETRPTSHLDFAPTVLELLGADPDGRADWALGSNLLEPETARRRVVAGWHELGVWTPKAIVRVPLSAFSFDVEVYDYRWRLLAEDAALLAAEEGTLRALGAECKRFLR